MVRAMNFCTLRDPDAPAGLLFLCSTFKSRHYTDYNTKRLVWQWVRYSQSEKNEMELPSFARTPIPLPWDSYTYPFLNECLFFGHKADSR